MLISYYYMLFINKLVKKYKFKRRVVVRNFIFYGLRFVWKWIGIKVLKF